MKSFKISTYNISSTRLTGKQKVTFAILADLHGLVFGKNHQTLYKAIIASQPDAVLVCGDLVVSRDTETLEAAAGLLLRICDQIPVFMHLEITNTKCSSIQRLRFSIQTMKNCLHLPAFVFFTMNIHLFS